LGGYGILNPNGYFERTYRDLPPHDAIYFKIKITTIDWWQNPDTVVIQLDGKNFTNGDVGQINPYLANSVCGSSSYKDLSRAYEMGKIFHTSESITVRVISLVNSSPTVTSFGIREVNMFLVNKTENDLEMGCFASEQTKIPSNNCTCPLLKYPNPGDSSQCLACDKSCAACFGPGADQCYGCNSGYSFVDGACTKCDSSCLACSGIGDNQCIRCSTSLWYTWDNRCSDSCDPPYVGQTLGSTKMCMTPCGSTEYFLWDKTCVNNCSFPHLVVKSTEFGQFCELPCGETEFLDWNGQCRTNCDYPFVAGNNSVYLTCNLPCPRSSDYLYPNGTCQPFCNTPFVAPEPETEVKLCQYPCEFFGFLYLDGSCLDSCPYYQYKKDNITFCSLCASGFYQYSNGSCFNSCDFPFEAAMANGSALCLDKCFIENKVLKYDGTCLEKCESPLVSSAGVCDKPCSDEGYFFYENGSCTEACPPPFVARVSDNIRECVAPCFGTLDYFYNQSQTCSPKCTSPHKSIILMDSIKVCYWETSDYSKAQEEVKPLSSLQDISQNSAGIGIILVNVFGATNPATAFLSEFVQMLPYIKYIGIKYPLKLQVMLDNMNSTLISFSFGIDIPNSLMKEFRENKLPENFQKYHVASNFLVNYWKRLTSFGIIIAVITVLSLMEFIFKEKGISMFLDRLNLILKWNYLLMIFCTNFGEVALYSSLYLRSLNVTNFAEASSLIICLIVNILAVLVLMLIIFIIKDIRKMKIARILPSKKLVDVQSPMKKWERFQLFYVGSKESSFIQQVFMFPYLLRFYIFYSVVAYLFEHPLCQTILITMLSVLILSYILWKKPFASKLVFVQHTSDEIVMLIVNICLVSLAICDEVQLDYSSDFREALGNIIIYSNLVLCMTTNIYLIAYLTTGFKSAYQKSKKVNKSQGILAYLTVFLAPFESGGMDVDVLPDRYEKPLSKPNKKIFPIEKFSQQSVEESSRSLIKQPFYFMRRSRHSVHSSKTATTLSESNLLQHSSLINISQGHHQRRKGSSIFELIHSPK